MLTGPVVCGIGPRADDCVLVEAVILPDGRAVIVGSYESCYPPAHVALEPGEYHELGGAPMPA